MVIFAYMRSVGAIWFVDVYCTIPMTGRLINSFLNLCHVSTKINKLIRTQVVSNSDAVSSKAVFLC